MNLRKVFLRCSLVLMVVCLSMTLGFAGEFCGSYDSWNNDKIAFNDLREITLPNLSLLEVNGRKNGGIKVVGENRSDIMIQACVRTWAETEAEAKAFANNTRIETTGVVRAENPDGNAKYSVSYRISVPTMTSLKLTANNGGISISKVNGDLQFSTKNGGLKIYEVGGNVKGRTKNGGVKVYLAGSSFNGSGLDVETKNGGVKLIMPANFAANIEAGTVNGGFKSDFPELAVEKKDDDNRYYRRNKRVNASINGGGVPIRVVTTNGGVKISSRSDKNL